MARFLNHTSHALTSFEHGWHVLADAVLEWVGYDPEKHGATPGLTRLDPPPAETDGGDTGTAGSKPKRKTGAQTGTTITDTGSGTGDGTPSDGTPAGANNDAADAAGTEPTS